MRRGAIDWWSRELKRGGARNIAVRWHSLPIVRPLLNALLYLPSRTLLETPACAGLPFEELTILTEDGERLHAWWIRARPGAREAGHVLLFHGNGGNIGDRVAHADLLSRAGLDVLLLDYRGYGRSTGRPSEAGIERDARAALAWLRSRPDVDPARVSYLGESLGGAVALRLALEAPPRALILHSTFTSVRDMARLHYRAVPSRLVPDAYPSSRLVPEVRAPVLVIHGERDDIVPVSHARALFEAAPAPKRLVVLPDAGHNDLLVLHGERWAAAIVAWVDERQP